MKNEFQNLAIYIISLDSSKDRYQRITDRLDKIGLEGYIRISATCKDSFSESEFDKKAFYIREGRIPVDSEICCYLSHYKTIQAFVDSDKEYALIFEDDMVFNADFTAILKELLSTNFSWDMVKLNASNDRGILNIAVKNIYKDYHLRANLFPKTKAGAYLINKKAAKNYLAKLLPITMTYDHEFIKYWKYDIRQYSVMPMPSKEERVDSTIAIYGKKGRHLRFPVWKRVPTFFYRFFYVQVLRALFFYKLLKK